MQEGAVLTQQAQAQLDAVPGILAALHGAWRLLDTRRTQGIQRPAQRRHPEQHGQGDLPLAVLEEHQYAAGGQGHGARHAAAPAHQIAAALLGDGLAQHILGSDGGEPSGQRERHQDDKHQAAADAAGAKQGQQGQARRGRRLKQATDHPYPLAPGLEADEAGHEQLWQQGTGFADRHQQADHPEGGSDHPQ